MSSSLLRLWLLLALLAIPAELRADPVGRRGPEPTVTTITVTLNGAIRLQMAKQEDAARKAPLIGRVEIEKSGIVEVRPAVDDQATVIVRGLAVGLTRLDLTTTDGKQRETYQVIVEPDMALLNYLLKRTVPT